MYCRNFDLSLIALLYMTVCTSIILNHNIGYKVFLEGHHPKKYLSENCQVGPFDSSNTSVAMMESNINWNI